MTVSTLVRWAVRAIGVVLVLALGCLLVLRIVGARRMAAAEREFEAKAGPLPENLYASDRVPDEENAAILLRAGAEAVILLDKDKARAGDLTMTALRVWSHQDLAFLRDLLARNGPALELLRRTAGMTRSGFGLKDPADVDEELKTKLPLLKLLWAQRLLFLDAQVALREGAFARLADDVKAMSVLAVAVEREAPLISELVGIAAEKIVLETISDAVAHPELDAGTLSVLATTIPELDLRAAWRRSLACEFKMPQMSVASRPGPDAKRSLLKTAYLAAPGYFDAPYVEWMARIMQAPDAPYGSSLPALMEQHPRCSISPLDAITSLTQAAGRNQVVLSERRLARLHDHHRSLCLWSRVNRGTPEVPGLVFGLDHGGSCSGVVFRIPGQAVPETFDALWAREMGTGAYLPRWLPCDTEEGMVSALAFVIDQTGIGYVPRLPEDDIVRIILRASGTYGPCIDYVLQTAEALKASGICDDHLEGLATRLLSEHR